MKKEVDKSKTLVKLGFYMLFLLTVVLLIVTTKTGTNVNNGASNSEMTNKKTYLDKEKELINGKYNYTFTIDDGLITYVGVAEDGIRTGKKTIDGAFIQYEESEIIYRKDENEKIVYDDLYSGLDVGMFNFKELFERLNAENCMIDRNGDEIIYSYSNISNYDYTITVNSLHIIKIQIDGEHKYNFVFTY